MPHVHPDDAAVDLFAAAMKEKLARKRQEGRGGWEDKEACPPGHLQKLLVEHLAKGDPVDVANFAMMLWSREEPTHCGGLPVSCAATSAPGYRVAPDRNLTVGEPAKRSISVADEATQALLNLADAVIAWRLASKAGNVDADHLRIVNECADVIIRGAHLRAKKWTPVTEGMPVVPDGAKWVRIWTWLEGERPVFGVWATGEVFRKTFSHWCYAEPTPDPPLVV